MPFEQVMLRLPNGQEYGPATMTDLTQWREQGRLPTDAVLVDMQSGEIRPVSDFSVLMLPPPPPPSPSMKLAMPGAPTAMDHMIPVKNPKALIAYYLGVFSIACGPLLGPAALILGILGLRDAKQLNVGRTHALVGIIAGSITALLGIVAIIAFVLSVH